MTIIPHNKPMPPKELQILTSLHPRMKLSTTEKQNYENLHKGFLGELKFYDLLCNHPSTNQITLFDLLLESNNTEFQIDSLIINQNTIFSLEIKNFEGDFYLEGDKWFVVGSGKEIRSPLLQLQRTEYLFKQILQKLHVNMTIKPYIIFINDDFTLYQAPIALPAIFPTQVKRFINKLNANSRKLTAHHTKLAKKLISMHLEESAHSRLPSYEYHQLQKGITCRTCSEFLSPINKMKLKCQGCGYEEAVDYGVMRSVAEFNLLFPKKITTSQIHEWCVVISSKRRIREILLRHMTLIRNGRYSYYVFKKI
ncbi:nuclease-related domain-containing protein [Pseudogracilibacillus auburnensis]|uniref:nuclease-related domain-containing protein n=1 Tax=Pseudogracilibacillus auburnensis TaxID=1494959 RepID=UPI001A969C46|nr:nuclease-related domain-containing protein [Pseudogracilibacillus auburnensis]MBO1005281.1 NERD domain-containing protein [Pseudogracilibacillus auburnensis]